MSDKKQIITTIKLDYNNWELYIIDKEWGSAEIRLERKNVTFRSELVKYDGLKVKATIYNPNDEDSDLMGFPLYATIDEILE
jgi:hypothetical protein